MRANLEEYLRELRARNYSASRLIHVGRAVSLLTLYLEEAHRVCDWREVELFHLQGFTVFAATRYRTPRGRLIGAGTLRQWLSCVRVFFAWMRSRGRLTCDPAGALRLPKASRPLPRAPGERAMARLIETPDTSLIVGVRDRALMETLYATGIRHGEAHRLNIYDVDLESGLLIVREGKGGRDRYVPLTETAVQWLSLYVTSARPQLIASTRGGEELHPSSEPAMWLSRRGGRLSYQMIAERVAGYAALAGVEATVHTFRHSCATHLLRGGAGTRYIQRLLGHKTVETTEIYTHVEVKDLRRVMQRAFNRLGNGEAVK
jgi:integrase/recombinase XerD